MDLAGLGQKIKQTHPEYSDIPDHELGQKIVTKYPQYGNMVTAANPVVGAGQHVSDFLRAIHLQAIPDMAGTVYGAGQELLQGKNPTAIPGGPQPTSDELQKNYRNNPFMTQQEGQKTGGSLKDIVGQAGKGALGVGAYLAPFAAGPLTAAGPLLGQQVAAGAGNLAITGGVGGAMQGLSQDKVTPMGVAGSTATGALLNVLLQGPFKAKEWMGKAGLAQMTSKAAEEATKQGVAFSNEDVKQAIISEATKNGKDTPEMARAIDEMFKNKMSKSIAEQGYMTPNDLLNLRRNLTTSEGGNLFQQILSHLTKNPGTDAELQAMRSARNVASDLVHQTAPTSVAPDQLYALYKRFGGSPGEWMRRIAATGATDLAVRKLPFKNSALESALDLLAGGIVH